MSLILAIESSCDDTSVAVVKNGRRVRSNVLASQLDVHARYGGVIPELAARTHLEAVHPTLEAALQQAGCTLDDVSAVAATFGPGLLGSLLVGVSVAKTLAWWWNKPLIAVNHLQGHIASTYLESTLEPPFLCLLVSGGHTQFWGVDAYNQQRLLGETLDDAVGEVYDKVARELGLGYPGGPLLDALAQQGDPTRYRLPIAKTKAAYDTSFSGLKTASLRLKTQLLAEAEGEELSPQVLKDVCASFQATAVRTLLAKLQACSEAHGYTQWAIAGGVSANSELRQQATALAERLGISLFLPQRGFCTDNAAMIASAAYYTPLHQGTAAWEADIFATGSL